MNRCSALCLTVRYRYKANYGTAGRFARDDKRCIQDSTEIINGYGFCWTHAMMYREHRIQLAPTAEKVTQNGKHKD